MNAFPGAAGPRRAPMDRQRYRRAARQTGIKTRLRRRLVLVDLALLAVAFVFVLLAGPRIGGAMSRSFDEFGGQPRALFPDAPGSKVLDRQPPTLAVTRPASGDSVEAPTVSVQGKAETGATISVNDRMVIPAPDGSFSDSFTASAGPLTITVVARDRAGNETTVKNQV